MSHSRVSGFLICCFGLILFFIAIPYDTEVVDYGWMRPQTLPNYLAWVLIVFGAIIGFTQDNSDNPDLRQMLKAAAYLGILVAGIFLTNRFGFVFVSPILALTLMWFMGERRVGWLGLGAIGIPFMLWLIVEVLLGRLLP